jgi:outer membrane protein OmpA-like peptidoglycan-associated protein
LSKLQNKHYFTFIFHLFNQNLTVMRAIHFILIAALFFSSTACSSLKKNKNTSVGVGTGAIVGGVIGGLLGKKGNNSAGGVIIGAAIGGVAGGAIGRYMDKQKRDLEKQLGNTAKVERVGEGLQISFDSGILFEFGSSSLSSSIQTKLREFSETLKKYADTNILIDGHTDNVGSDDFNLKLSHKRAESVQSLLMGQGVSSSRLGTRGFGEGSPVATNDTDAGRAKNRRVEISIWANDKLKEKANTGAL